MVNKMKMSDRSGLTKPRISKGRRVLIAAAGVFGAALISMGIFLAIEWPKGSLSRSTGSLASVQLKGIPQSIKRVSVVVNGKAVPVSDSGGNIVPTIKLPASTSASVTVYLRRPSWISWLVGGSEKLSEHIVTPSATLLDPVSVGPADTPVSSYFSTPVSEVLVSGSSGTKIINLPTPSSTIVLNVASGSVGSVDIAASPDVWETLPNPSKMVYFRESTTATVGFIDENLSSLSPMSPISLTLSKPISSVFGSSMPTLQPVIKGSLLPKGSWKIATPNSIVYTPTAPDFWPSEKFTLSFPSPIELASTGGSQLSSPTSKISLEGASPSITRLQQLLAQLHYLPLSWKQASSGPTPTLAQQAQLALVAPSGTFAWRWTMPSPLTSLWQQGNYNVITKGAVMAFEQFNGLDTSGLANPLLWPTLINDVLMNKIDPHRYSWIEVNKILPQKLTLYENGSVVLTSLTNTGIKGLSTTNGTFPIYLRFKENYMSGTNPNGTTYHDRVYWINYFLGSEAVHGFPRAQYGFQQSLGCVELPVSTAATVYPQVHIGTLTTILPS